MLGCIRKTTVCGKFLSPLNAWDILMTDTIATASNIANVVVALANIALLLFLFWQISLQKRFYLEQAHRDAAQKISSPIKGFRQRSWETETWRRCFIKHMTGQTLKCGRFGLTLLTHCITSTDL